MPRGPLPDPDSVRRNPATIPTTVLPADGRSGPPPDVPEWADLARSGREWWNWAWSTPEAAGWTSSAVDVVAQRAELVDDLVALRRVDSLDAFEILEGEDGAEVKRIIGRLAGLATGRLQIVKTMALLDQQLGFGAKNRLALRWTVDDEAANDDASSSGSPSADVERPLDKEALIVEAAAHNVEISKRWGPKRIRETIDAALAARPSGSRGRLTVVNGG